MKPVSKTAYYWAGIRMQDAESPHPLIGDKYAKSLLGKEGTAYWEEFKNFEKPNAGNLARHYIIDEHIKKLLTAHPNSTILIIGAGFDSRAYRFTSGTWIEVDETAIIEYKNRELPTSNCRNKLERIAIDFEKEKLKDKLLLYANRENVIVIIEGVLMYLTAEQKNELLQTIITFVSQTCFVVRSYDQKNFHKAWHNINEKLSAHGSSFNDINDHPAQIFIDHGYEQIESASTINKAVQLHLTYLP